MQDVPKKYTVTLPAEMVFSSSIRRVSDDVFQHLGFSDPDLFRLILVIDELFMNAVQHGSQKGAYIHVCFEYTDKTVTVRVDDEGGNEDCNIEDLKDIMSLEFQRHDPKKISGRGLAQIALNLADDLQFEKNSYGGIRVIFIKSLPGK